MSEQALSYVGEIFMQGIVLTTDNGPQTTAHGQQTTDEGRQTTDKDDPPLTIDYSPLTIHASRLTILFISHILRGQYIKFFFKKFGKVFRVIETDFISNFGNGHATLFQQLSRSF